jgi:c-di-GMP-binding flagellar brake protein YcgR
MEEEKRIDDERRKASRIKRNLTIQYAASGKKELRWEMTLIKDISDTGMLITTGQKFAAEENLYIRLKLPSQPFKLIEITAGVILSANLAGGSYLTRVKFLQLGDDDKKQIKDYITWFLGKERGAK